MAEQSTTEVPEPVPTETTNAAPPASTAAPEAPKLSPTAQKLASEFGLENVASDEDAFERAILVHKQLKDEFGTQLRTTIEELRQQPTTQPTPQVQEAQGPWWNPPKVDQALVAKYRTAEGWKPETPAEVRQAGDAAQAYYDRWAADLVHRPHEVLPKLIREEALKIVREELGQTAQKQQLSQFQQRVFGENPWLFEPDPITGKPKTGALSAEGKLIDQYMQEAQERGADYELSWEFAFAKHQAAKAAAQSKQTEAAKSAEQINADKKREMLARGNGPNRTGSLPTPSETRTTQRNKNLTPGQRFVQHAQRNGIAIT